MRKINLSVIGAVVLLLALAASPTTAQSEQGGAASGAPGSVTVARGDGTLIVSWDAVSGADAYNVNTSDDGAQSWVRAVSDVAGTGVTISNVSNAATYIVAVQAVVGGVPGGWTNSAPAGPYVPPTRHARTHARSHTDAHAAGHVHTHTHAHARTQPTPAPTPTPEPELVALAQQQQESDNGFTIASDNDQDNDNLIDVTTAAQFIAMQWDLNGDGTPESNSSAYNTAFDGGVSGCSSTCAGYELSNDITISLNPSNAGTSYLVAGTFDTTFHGNGNDITNNDRRPLFQNIGGTATTTSPAEVKSLNVENAHSTGANSAILADKVQAGGKVTNVNVTGKVSVTSQMDDDGGVGALVNTLEGGVISGSGSYAEVYVEGPDVGIGSQAEYSVGGLVGYVKSGTLLASYAAGAVTYKRAAGYWDEQGRRYAGGLAGRVGGEGKVYASYAWGNVTASENYRATANFGYTAAGGLVGVLDSGGTVRAGYATGAVAPPAGTLLTAYRTNYAGKALGKNDGGTFTSVYGSGAVTSNQTVTVPTGSDKTESELKTPTGYTGIYATWDDHDIDGDSTNDLPWNFGTASQFPVISFTPSGGSPLPPTDQQPVTLTMTAAATTISEGSTTTITPTLSGTRNYAVRVTNPTGQSRYTYDFTIPKGNTTTTAVTFTATGNSAKDGDTSAALTGAVITPANSVDIAATSPTITIQDDEIHDVTGFAASQSKQNDGTYDITITWGAPNAVNTRNAAGTDGYDLEYSTDSGANWTTVTTDIPIATVTHTLDNVTVYRTYQIRIRAKGASKNGDYSSVVNVEVGEDFDADDDGYIEVSDLAELDAIRYDLNADGTVSSSDETNYLAAFTNAMPSMGCPSTGCVGYELRASLDFDTNGSGGADSGDTYWNNGNGWDPIGGGSSQYSGNFDGNADTDASGDGGPYTISNLFIDRTAGNYAGLFGYVYSSNKSIEDIALVNVDVTLNATANDNVYAGGLMGRMGGGSEIEDSYTTGRVRAGESASEPVTFTAASKDAFVGGLVGEANTSPISSSYSLADVTSHVTSAQSGPTVKAGGLAGAMVGTSANDSYVVAASYAGGDVVASAVGTALPGAYAGGLVADWSATNGVKASYARGDVSATVSSSGPLMAGGLLGFLTGDVITGSYSTGAVSTTGAASFGGKGGLAGFSAGSAVNSYWDTETSGESAGGVSGATGKTTSELQTPRAYGTGSSIYAAWNLNLDGQTGNDDPWDFGTANQYPTLKYGSQVSGDQRATVTLSLDPSTIWERALTTPSRVNSATVTATLDKTWNRDVVVTLATSTAYTLSPETVTISKGAATTTATLTAVNNYVDAANNTVALTLDTHPADTKWVVKGTDVSITINDDDELTKPTGVKLSVDGTKIRVDWTAVTGATGYKVQWHTASTTAGWLSPTGTQTITSGSTVTHSITSGLTAGTRYYVRVLPTKTGADEPPSDVSDVKTHGTSPNTVDYDADNDGLIEVSGLAQLNAIRYDLDGDGVPETATTTYNTAFPNAEDNMGCNEAVVTIASNNNTGNPACTGYELRASLDFDTNSSGGPNSGDTYWNGGAGLAEPIGGVSGSAYTGAFDGNSDTDASGDGGPYTISNLFIDRTTGNYAGLFAYLNGASGTKGAGRRAGERGRYVQHDGLRLQHGRLHGRAGRARRRRRDDRGQLRHRAGAGRRVGHRAGHHQRQHRELVRRRAGGPPGRRRSVELLARGRDGLHQGNHA